METWAAFEAASPALAAGIVGHHARQFGRRPIVALYDATADETPTDAIADRLTRDGYALALPIIGARQAPLIFRTWRPGDEVAPGPFGIRQPTQGNEVEPDILFVPLVAFDSDGRRLGYGGGFYDRTLAALRTRKPVLTVGLAFSAQHVLALPAEAHDEPLDAVLTEAGLAVDRRSQ